MLEAGGDNKDRSFLYPADRFTLAATEPALNWGYKTEPQEHLNGQRIDYSRGKGLGGSTAIHFCAWIAGASADFDEWARLVGDADFNWDNVKERLKSIENFHGEIPKEYQAYLNPKIEGTNNVLEMSFEC